MKNVNENLRFQNSQADDNRIEKHPLEPFLPEQAVALMLGSFPPPREKWTMNFYYPNFQNDMWRIFGLVFFGDKDYFVAVNNKSFNEELIRQFLIQKGIALYDTVEEAIRQKGNASDNFLETVKPVDLQKLLLKIPACDTIVTTGQKATETVFELLGFNPIPPVGGHVNVVFMSRPLRCYRMPSSSRAYPKPLTEKAAIYSRMFSELFQVTL